MNKFIEILVDFQPFIWLLIGAVLPFLEKQIEKLARSKEYQLAYKVYQSIDPEFLDKLGGKYRFVELIQESIKAASDRELSYAEIQNLTKLVIRDFRLGAALGKADGRGQMAEG
ncbi:MAG: hypothetical protein QNJ41_12055 [Xenococcaceae cyanobacterium MO_188.B32]|nr:hypothetical protein [Xenococcaceae cyanobacterium MO_188.B32]